MKPHATEPQSYILPKVHIPHND